LEFEVHLWATVDLGEVLQAEELQKILRRGHWLAKDEAFIPGILARDCGKDPPGGGYSHNFRIGVCREGS